MAYRGITETIDCSKGGLTGNLNIEAIHPAMMVYPTRNINLHNGGRQKRGGTAHVYESAFTGAPHVVGLYDFLMDSGTRYVIAATSDGKVWKNATETIATGMSTSTYFSLETGDNQLFIVDGVSMPQVWTGTGSVAEIAHPASDWTTNKPFQFIKYGRYNSQRMWAICKNGIYGSTTSDFEDFTDTSVIFIPIDTADGFGLQGAGIYGGRLYLFGKKKAYILEDTDTDTDLWGYTAAEWEGGVANFRLIIKTTDDLVCMTEEGEIYSVGEAESEDSEVEKVSLIRRAWMHSYIQERISLTYIGDFHGVYDPVLRAIKIFVVRSGQVTIDTALVYFVDKGSEQGWMLHDNQQYVSGYSATSSALIRKAAGDYKIYTGGYSGYVWELETTARDDNSNGFLGKVTTPIMNFGDSTISKHFNKLRIIADKEGDYNLTIDWWVDDVAQTAGSISLNSTKSFIDALMTLGKIGKRIQFSIYNSTADQDFFIHKIILYYKPVGRGNKE